LLAKLIHFDSLSLEKEQDTIKHKLYTLFFDWRNHAQPSSSNLQNDEELDKEELKKRQ
jgi:hypothetical protein